MAEEAEERRRRRRERLNGAAHDKSLSISSYTDERTYRGGGAIIFLPKEKRPAFPEINVASHPAS